MDPEGAVSGSVNIETKKAADEGNRKIGLGWFSNNRAQGTFDLGQRFGENKEFGVRANGKLRHGDTPRHGYSEDNKEFALNADYRGEKTARGVRFHLRETQNQRRPRAYAGHSKRQRTLVCRT